MGAQPRRSVLFFFAPYLLRDGDVVRELAFVALGAAVPLEELAQHCLGVRALRQLGLLHLDALLVEQEVQLRLRLLLLLAQVRHPDLRRGVLQVLRPLLG